MNYSYQIVGLIILGIGILAIFGYVMIRLNSQDDDVKNEDFGV